MYITEYGNSISNLSGQLICGTKAGTDNYWSHRNINKRFKEKCGRHNRKAFNRALRTTAILGTLHKLRGGMQSETRSLTGGDRRGPGGVLGGKGQ